MTIHFAFAIPTRNSRHTLRQALMSIAAQSHHDWQVVIIDDASTDGTPEAILDTAAVLGIAEKVTLVRNITREWEVANVLKAMALIEPDEVVCRLDLDDYLCDLNALEIMAKAYEQVPDLEAAWSNHRWFDQNGVTNQNISGPMSNDADPYAHPWVTSHMKTWRKSVSDKISDANYRSENEEEYIKRAGDQCVYLPVLKLAKRRIHVPVAMYAYRCDMSPQTFQTDDAKSQKEEAEFLRKRGFIT